MKTTAAAVLVALGFAAAIGVSFALGQQVGAKDARLFAEEDSRRTKLIARSCGKTGELLQAPETKKYSCLWRNSDGQVLVADVPDFPYAGYLAQR
ncbi:hypothetical protein ACXIUT_27810 [Achromobacter denitrificans]